MSEESDQKKAEEINVAKYKIIVWSDGCFARFRSRFVFHLLTKNFFLMVSSSRGTTTKKPWKGSHGRCWKDREKHHLPQSQIGLCYDWFTFRVPSNHTEICPVSKKCLCTWCWCLERAWEHRTAIQKDSRNPQATSCGKVWSERGIKVFLLAVDEQPFYTEWYSNGKYIVICGQEIADVHDKTVLCALVSAKKSG